MTDTPERDDEQAGPEGAVEDEGQGAGPAEDLESDPAYNPQDEGLKDIKGG